MGELIKLSDHVEQWKEIFTSDNECSTVRICACTVDGSVEVYSMDDDGKGVRIILKLDEVRALTAALDKLIAAKST